MRLSWPIIWRGAGPLMATAVLFTVLTSHLSAQRLIDPREPADRKFIGQVHQILASGQPNSMACKVTAYQPTLNFALRYQAGYQVTLPMEQFPKRETRIHVGLRVRPLDDPRVFYFHQRADLPPEPRDPKLEINIGGGFLVGEGRYVLESALFDDSGRSCAYAWQIDLQLDERERALVKATKPGDVGPLVLPDWEKSTPVHARPYKIAVIVHAAPLFPRSVRMTAYDRSLLGTAVAALFDHTPFRDERVQAISLAKQEVLFETGRLDRPALAGMLNRMEELELGTIGLEQLENPKGYVDLLAKTVNQVAAGDDPPHAIVFIGPNSRQIAGFPKELLESAPGAKPLFFYLHLDYFARRFPFADTIERLTKRHDGKVFRILGPRDLAAALTTMETMLTARASRIPKTAGGRPPLSETGG